MAMWQDLRFAVRMMSRSRGFAAVAVISLALGIGANTAIFSLLNTVVLRQLPVRAPEELAEVLYQYPGDPWLNGYNAQSQRVMRGQNDVFSATFSSAETELPVQIPGRETEALATEYVDGSYFPVLGLQAALGRLPGPEDARTGTAAVGVLSWSYWQSRFQGSRTVLGTHITVRETPVTVIGVAPSAFTGVRPWVQTQVWVAAADAGGALLGRLKPGTARERAAAEMAALFRQSLDEATLRRDPQMGMMQFRVERAGAGMSRLRDEFGKPLEAVMAVVGLLLLLTCTNVASMLLARAAGRDQEMAVRVALGAGRWRLVRQVLTESVLMSALGGAAGVLVAYWGSSALVGIVESGRDNVRDRIAVVVQPDAHVLLFAVGATVLTGVLFGLAPALRAARRAPAGALRGGRSFGKGLVAAQVAFSVVLLSAAGLFGEHLSALRNNLGFDREHLLLVTLEPSHSGLSTEARAAAYQRLLERLGAIPGVRSATLSAGTPISGAGASRFVSVEGFEERPEARRYVQVNWVAPNYFETMGVPLLAGRSFRAEDRGRAVAVVNRAMARYYFGDGDPVGRQFTVAADKKTYEIVGLVGDAKYYEARETEPLRQYYLGTWDASNFALRTSIGPAQLERAVRAAVSETLAGVSVRKVTTMSAQVDAAIVPERLMALLAGMFGVLGAVLAAIGLFGLLAYAVARRTKEIGVRMALGATRGEVGRMVVRESMWMVCVGLAIGVPAALWGRAVAGRWMEGLGVDSVGPIAMSVVVMIGIGLVAAWVPGWRAARVEPMAALRQE